MRARIFAEENRKWLTLASVSFGLFMIMLDNTVVNVALPSIQRDLGADLSELEWIVTGYALTFASLMLVGGKVADAYGRRRIFVIGIVVFTAASLWCGLSNSGEMLIAARVVQGAGAALMNPATLSIIAATASGVRSAHACTHVCAMFRRAPPNHVVHSIPRESSSTSSHGRARSSSRSAATARQKRSGSSTETRCSAA